MQNQCRCEVVIPVRYESEDRLYCDCLLHQRQYDGIKCTELTGTIDSGCLYQRQGQCTFHVLLHIEESSRCCDCRDDQGDKVILDFISATNWINPSAVTWVGMVMIARIKVNMNFFNLKSYTWIAYAVMVEK